MKKAVIYLCASFAACLLIAGILLGVRYGLCGNIYDQTAAERWSADGKGFVQHSVFISESANAGLYTVNELRASIRDALTAESYETDGDTEAFFDAYSAKMTVSLARDTKSVRATAYFTGGDFFRFHSLDILSGWYYNEYDLMDDCVLMNTFAAWQTYGSYDIVGKTVQVSGYPCMVYGVFDDSDENAAGEPVIYTNYSLLYKMGTEDAPITCYETVLPEPVRNFARGILDNAVSFSENEYEIVKSTGRYDFISGIRGIKGFLSRTDKNNTVIYPSWENSARRAETLSIIFAFLILLMLVYPTALLVFALVALYIKKGMLFGLLRDKVTGMLRRR